MAIRPAMSWNNHLTSLTRLRAPQRSSLISASQQIAAPRGSGNVLLRWSSNGRAPQSESLKNKTQRPKREVPEIPDEARNSVILKQFDNETDVRSAFWRYSKGYFVLKGKGAQDKKPFLTFGKFALRWALLGFHVLELILMISPTEKTANVPNVFIQTRDRKPLTLSQYV
ncbi:hypothetical protein N7490_004061 [Penicillium lividum]|nr:hypothetical protein N7490_004061 [Penicillium lividum]